MEKRPGINTTFLLSGGAGRIITAIPALEKYARLNPNDDFKVIVHGWENVYWNHPLLQHKTFGISTKGIFDNIVKNSKIIAPEPYYVNDYYNQKISLIEAFDKEINKTDNHNDLDIPRLYLHSSELNTVKIMIEKALKDKQKSKFVVFQPFGSGATINNNFFSDSSNRSLDQESALKLGRFLSKDAVVLYFGPSEFIHPDDNFMLNAKNLLNNDLRFYIAMISQCDFFVGIDSVGQHIARSFNKPGLVIMGSTFEKNVSYPDHFKFYRNGIKPTYIPLRIGGIDCDFADRANDQVMKFTNNQIEQMYLIARSL